MWATVATMAQPGANPPPMNVLQLSADGSVEVQQDLLSITLRAHKNGTDATSVQAELKQALDSALAAVRPDAKAGQMDVRTGNFNLHPRYTRDGAMNGWEGNAELVLQGRDFPRVTQAAGRVSTLTVSNIAFALSPEASDKAETEAQTLAIAAFKKKAEELAKGFGFSGYTLREVSVNQGSPMPKVMAMRAPMAASASADAPVPVEPGKANVVVNVNGSVQLK
ncbi:SIMPL domain-containing protein [Variovorax dokdonensis]|uniref:SIMPL domain-containing protein n=2 Tax=Variovorax dokdonensis TaxID=344883 RepID=A0ABT7N8M1_9BURK|nr:SIMPL domain-containing protein [Variovorax dokdonensis]MDM0044294.1 SIMPL domain-containing protein [Variovorax dokdonensis]